MTVVELYCGYSRNHVSMRKKNESNDKDDISESAADSQVALFLATCFNFSFSLVFV